MAERTDRELLEMAAKAAGLTVDFSDAIEFANDVPPFEPGHMRYFLTNSERAGDFWNPLTKDGDALRLAVKLGLEIGRGIGGSVYAFRRHDCSGISEAGPDLYAATRRAIVRAAAEIGAKE